MDSETNSNQRIVELRQDMKDNNIELKTSVQQNIKDGYRKTDCGH